MRLDTGEAREVTMRGIDNAPHDAQIAATPAMFKIFYDQIYTRKEEAIVRELLCNAIDSHVAQGTTNTAIDVHLPTVLEPWFEIKDYGTGLSPDDVLALYMNYGNSNKRHTNTLIGGFGLGSKAPFCLTDQFTVVTRWDDRKYTFQAYLKEDNAPACVLVGEDDNDEHLNGLTIYVPLSETGHDRYRFQDAIEKFAPHSVVPLDINVPMPGKPEEAWVTVEAAHSDKVEFRKNVWNYRKATVVMGPVPYTVDLDDLSDDVHRRLGLPAGNIHSPNVSARNQYIGSVLIPRYNPDYDITVYAPVGTYEHTVSREQLSLTETTRARITDTLIDAVGKLYDELLERINRADTVYEWAEACQDARIDSSKVALPAKLQKHANYVHGAFIKWDEYVDRMPNLDKRGMLSRDMSLKRKARSIESRALMIKDLQHTVIAVSPKRSYSKVNFGEQYFEQASSDVKRMICLNGTIADAKRMCRELGLPCEVIEMTKIQKQRESSGRAGIRGATKYLYRRLTSVADGNVDRQLTASEFVEAVEAIKQAKSDARIVVQILNDPVTGITNHLDTIGELGKKRVVTQHFDYVYQIVIPEQHTRVRTGIEASLTEIGASVITGDLFKALKDSGHITLNHRGIKRLAMRQQLIIRRGNQQIHSAYEIGGGAIARLDQAQSKAFHRVRRAYRRAATTNQRITFSAGLDLMSVFRALDIPIEDYFVPDDHLNDRHDRLIAAMDDLEVIAPGIKEGTWRYRSPGLDGMLQAIDTLIYQQENQ